MTDANLDAFLAALAARPDSPTVTNPYRGPLGEVRLHNLRTYLALVAALGPSVALIGEAPGYRGCAVTGIPFTSRQVLTRDLGCWGLFAGAGFVADASLGRPWAEATATSVWRCVPEVLPGPPLLANAFPFHPHPAGQPAQNRRLTAAELTEGASYLSRLLRLFPGVEIVAIGRRAEHASRRLGRTPLAAVRHPAHGGAAAFARGLASLARSMVVQ